MKKGQDVVDTNHRAIDAGATAFSRSTFPLHGPMHDKEEAIELAGKPELVKMVSSIMEPCRSHGWRQPARFGVHRPCGRTVRARRLCV